nr:MAG TPA: hypothetical protein [Caudoviricetes sp.]
MLRVWSERRNLVAVSVFAHIHFTIVSPLFPFSHT